MDVKARAGPTVGATRDPGTGAVTVIEATNPDLSPLSAARAAQAGMCWQHHSACVRLNFQTWDEESLLVAFLGRGISP